MAGETKRIRKPTKQFESWKAGDKHDSVRQRKRREKVKGQKKREMLKGKKLQKQGNVVMKDRAEEDLVQNKAKDLGQKSMDLLKGDPPKTKKSKQGQQGFSGVKKTKNKKK